MSKDVPHTFQGSCHCGSVTFEVESGFGVIACHCQDCQKLHGNFFALLLIEPSQLRMKTDSTVTWYRSSEKIQRSFCSKCGSRLFKKPDEGNKMMISMGLLGPITGLQIRKHVMPESKPDWYELPAIAEA